MDELWGKMVPDPENDEPAREQAWEAIPSIFTDISIQAFNQRSDEKIRGDTKH